MLLIHLVVENLILTITVTVRLKKITVDSMSCSLSRYYFYDGILYFFLTADSLVTVSNSCPGTITIRSSTSGIIYSNKDGQYTNYMSCYWSLSWNTNLELVFFRFETESGYDFVHVYDGGDSSSYLIGQYDGSSLPGAIRSSYNQLYVTFTSDGSATSSGFAASYHGKKSTK